MREKEGILSAEAGVHQHQRDKWSEQQKNYLGEFPCGLVVRIPGFHCCDAGSIPGGGTEIQQKKKKIIFKHAVRGRGEESGESVIWESKTRECQDIDKKVKCCRKVDWELENPFHLTLNRLWWPFWELIPLPWWLSSKRIHLQGRNLRTRTFDPWVRKIPWRRAWKNTPVILPGESHGQRSLAGYSP